MNTIQSIGVNQLDVRNSMKRVWGEIFRSSDPFGDPFDHSIKSKLVFFPTPNYHLNAIQYAAVTDAAKQFDKSGFFVSEVECEDPFVNGDHWWCAFPSFEEYDDLLTGIENSLYSPSGHWGLIISHENHAVLGGTTQFIEQVKLLYPNWMLDAEELRQTWSGHHADWTDTLLRKVLA